MCGPSGAMKQLNSQISTFAADMNSEGQQIFGDASGIFNELNTALGQIVKGGPSQQGWSQAEINAVNSQIMNQAAVNAKNIRAAVGGDLGAVGGGNAVTPSGLEAVVETQANLGVEAQKSQQLAQATVANYQQGTENYWNAVKGQMQLPNVFSTSIDQNKVTQGAYQAAEQSQQAIDKASNWWQPLVMAGIGTGASMLTGGLSNLGSGESFGEGIKDFASGALGTNG